MVYVFLIFITVWAAEVAALPECFSKNFNILGSTSGKGVDNYFYRIGDDQIFDNEILHIKPPASESNFYLEGDFSKKNTDVNGLSEIIITFENLKPIEFLRYEFEGQVFIFTYNDGDEKLIISSKLGLCDVNS